MKNSHDRGRWVLWIGLVILGVAVAAPVYAGSYYTWQTDDGVTAFTDDVRRIPSRYRGRAVERTEASIEGYRRYTQIESRKPAVAPQALPAVSAAPPAPTPEREVVQTVRPGVGVQLDLEQIDIDLSNLPSDEPVVVEKVRTRARGLDTTQTVQIVRQGDRVLAVIKPQPNQARPSFQRYVEDFEN